jgi:hypothetical protein
VAPGPLLEMLVLLHLAYFDGRVLGCSSFLLRFLFYLRDEGTSNAQCVHDTQYLSGILLSLSSFSLSVEDDHPNYPLYELQIKFASK